MVLKINYQQSNRCTASIVVDLLVSNSISLPLFLAFSRSFHSFSVSCREKHKTIWALDQFRKMKNDSQQKYEEKVAPLCKCSKFIIAKQTLRKARMYCALILTRFYWP